MSVNDPLIKDIKEITLRIFKESAATKITDSSRNLENLCQVIEKIFYQGLIQNQSIFFGNRKKEAYSWMRSLPTEGANLTDFSYKSSIEEIQSCKSVNTFLGKFRLLIRHCLVKKCLHFPLQSLIDSNKTQIYYEKTSVIGDEILSIILLSVLLQCNKINFDLDLCNCYFLDLTWQIPDLVKLELVPCKNLGISVSFSENKAVIVQVTPDSVASECGEILKCDVLANLNGVEINSSCKGRLNTILRLCKGKPVTLITIKAFYKHSGDIFLPMKKILLNLQMDSTNISAAPLNTSEEYESDGSELSIVQNTKTGYEGIYLGSTNVGNNGSVKQIGEAIKRCMTLSNNDVKKSVVFYIEEMNIKTVCSKTNTILFSHSYMQISSCGSAPKMPNYIAYMTEDKKCDGLNFACHVFYINDVENADAILRSIGQGFYRTHFAV